MWGHKYGAWVPARQPQGPEDPAAQDEAAGRAPAGVSGVSGVRGVSGPLARISPSGPPPGQPQASSEGVKVLHQCKLDLINPFHQLQIYLLNPIKNMNMQMQTFLNSHFQGLGVGV